jgi:hypothetical protein
LNPVEYVWAELKCQLHMKHSDIKNIRGGPNKVRERLAEVLLEIWVEIPDELFEKLWKSMSERVATVISVEGWYIYIVFGAVFFWKFLNMIYINICI